MSEMYVQTETLPITVYGQRQVSYVIGGETGHSFEEACVSSAYKRAVTQESEITPLSNVIRRRSAKLEELGTALSYVCNFVSLYAKTGLEDASKKPSSPADQFKTVYAILEKYSLNTHGYVSSDGTCSKADALKLQSDLQTEIETEQNSIEQDSNTLQSFVNKRDQAYEAIGKIQKKLFKSVNKTIDNIGG